VRTSARSAHRASTARRDHPLSQASALKGTSALEDSPQTAPRGQAPGQAPAMTPQSLVHVLRATHAQPVPPTPCLAQLESISQARASQPASHAKKAHTARQSDSRPQVDVAKMGMSALGDRRSPSHSTTSRVDCATLGIPARVDLRRPVIRARMPQSRVCLVAIHVLLGTTATIQMAQQIRPSAPLSTTVHRDHSRQLPVRQAHTPRYSSQGLRRTSNVQPAQPDTTVKMESTMPPSNAARDTSASPGHQSQTRRKTCAQWVSGARQEL
jgi:hypothetical protein